MYQIIVKKKDLDATLAAVAVQDPIVLPAWDPMGALASVQGEESGSME